jgi:hypothetical protein
VFCASGLQENTSAAKSIAAARLNIQQKYLAGMFFR